MIKDPGDWYREQEQKAKALSDLLAHAQRIDAPLGVINSIERALEMARYVGD